jgi:hypothetical protein
LLQDFDHILEHFPSKYFHRGASFAIAGQTADGDKFTSSTFLGPDGDLAIYDDLPSKGSLVGILDIVLGAADTNTLTGSPTWSRPENTATTATTYKAGFTPYGLVIMGGQYAAPAATAIILGKTTPARANNAGLAFFDAGLDDEPSRADRRVSLIPGKSLTIAAFGPSSAVPAPSAKPATCQNGPNTVGRTPRRAITVFMPSRCRCSWCAMWRISPAMAWRPPITASCPA